MQMQGIYLMLTVLQWQEQGPLIIVLSKKLENARKMLRDGKESGRRLRNQSNKLSKDVLELNKKKNL